jgi:hypothetical protein
MPSVPRRRPQSHSRASGEQDSSSPEPDQHVRSTEGRAVVTTR